MKTLAKAVFKTAAFVALGDEGVVTLDGKVAIIEEISSGLQTASAREVAAIRTALKELVAEERAGSARKDVITFYKGFMQGFLPER